MKTLHLFHTFNNCDVMVIKKKHHSEVKFLFIMKSAWLVESQITNQI